MDAYRSGYLLVHLLGLAVSNVQFHRTTILTTWRLADGEFVGHNYDELSCSRVCAERHCYATSLTADGRCYSVLSDQNVFEQRPLHNLSFWIRRGLPPSCNPSKFNETLDKSSYFIERGSKMNWGEAVAMCRSLGGKLLQVSSFKEMAFVWKLVQKDAKNTYHVGLFKDAGDSRLPHNEGWKWEASEEPLKNDSFLKVGEPSVGNDYCGSLVPKERDKISNRPCNSAHGFICECNSL